MRNTQTVRRFGHRGRCTEAAPPGWIAAYALHPELGLWLGAVLRRQWPLLRWNCTDDGDALQRWRVDLWLVDALPGALPQQPLLCLCGPERCSRLTRIRPLVWELPAPILAPALLAAVHTVLDDRPDSH